MQRKRTRLLVAFKTLIHSLKDNVVLEGEKASHWTWIRVNRLTNLAAIETLYETWATFYSITGRNPIWIQYQMVTSTGYPMFNRIGDPDSWVEEEIYAESNLPQGKRHFMRLIRRFQGGFARYMYPAEMASGEYYLRLSIRDCGLILRPLIILCLLDGGNLVGIDPDEMQLLRNFRDLVQRLRSKMDVKKYTLWRIRFEISVLIEEPRDALILHRIWLRYRHRSRVRPSELGWNLVDAAGRRIEKVAWLEDVDDDVALETSLFSSAVARVMREGVLKMDQWGLRHRIWINDLGTTLRPLFLMLLN